MLGYKMAAWKCSLHSTEDTYVGPDLGSSGEPVWTKVPIIQYPQSCWLKKVGLHLKTEKNSTASTASSARPVLPGLKYSTIILTQTLYLVKQNWDDRYHENKNGKNTVDNSFIH